MDIKLDMSVIKELEKAVHEAALESAEELVQDVTNSRTMPFNTGNLEQNNFVTTHTDSDGTHYTITNSEKYARYLYFGHKMVDRETGKGPAFVHDKNGGEVGFRFRKGAKLKVKQPIEELDFRGGRTSHWLEPYITGDKKDFVKDTFAKKLKEKVGG